MSTRISFTQSNSNILNRLFDNYNKLEGLQQQLSTGKKLNSSSDNPVGASESMEMRSEIDQFTAFQSNIDDGQAYLGTVDSTLQTSNNLYQSMRERAIQASNDTNSAESRFYIGKEVRGMFDQMVALSNTNFKGEYVFSGNNTDVPPYQMRDGVSKIVTAPVANSGDVTMAVGTPISLIDKNTDDSNDNANHMADAKYLIPGTVSVNGMTEGKDYTVDYVHGTLTFTAPGAAATAMAALPNGIAVGYTWLRRNEKDLDGVVNRQIEEGVSARLNTTASEVFGSNQESNAWEAMINLMDGTLNNHADKVRLSVGQLDDSLKRQLSAMASNGSRVLRYESTQQRNDDRLTYTTKLQSDVEDVDFAKAVSDFTLQQSVYDASLKMGARAIQNTLVNFL